MTQTILQTKLFIPPLRPSLVPRPHLLAKFTVWQSSKLILLSAPAGYGKTTLMIEWINKIQPDTPVCWFSLDSDDNDPQRFFSYLAAATESLTATQSHLSQQLKSPQLPPTKTLMTTFVNDLVSVSTPFVLVFDDYHMVHSADIDKALAFLLDHLPPQMTLAITSRTDPGFPISRLRSRGELLELRAEDLRFKELEVAQFLQESMGLALSPAHITALEAHTEGWIAGLQMAALSMRNRNDIEHFVANFTGSHRFIMDYLTDEVLNQAAPDVEAFLLQTAVLSRLNADLCEAILGIGSDNCQQILEDLHSHNIFLTPLDDERRWYRYHHLFAELLQKKAPKDMIRSTYQKAAIWSQQNSLIAEAIDYSLAAADYEMAAPLLAEHGLYFLFQSKLTTLLRWLDALPRDYLGKQPMLSIHYAWVLLNQGKVDEVEPYLQMAEAVSKEAPPIRTVTAIIRSSIARAREDIGTVQIEANLALQLASPTNLMARCAALVQVGTVQMMTGKGDEAIKTLQQAINAADQSQNLNVRFLAGGFLGLAHLLQNQAELAQNVLTTTQTVASELGLLESPLLSYVNLGLSQLAFLEQNFDGARSHAEKAIANCQLTQELAGLRWSALLLAQIEQAVGQFEAAENAFALAQKAANTFPNSSVTQQMEQLHSRLINRELGNSREILPWITTTPLSISAPPRQNSPVPSTMPALVEHLGSRENEILSLIGRGLKNQAIADELFISINTVHYHTKNIYSKLDVHTRTEAVAKAKDLNLL